MILPHLRYLGYVLKHKWFVLRAGVHLGVPLHRLLLHDLSKFSRSEWGPYVRRFYGGRSNEMDHSRDPEEFHKAFEHHWQANPHHWEFWVMTPLCPAQGSVPMEMPEVYVREMVADWMGAGKAKTGTWDVRGWYHDNRTRMRLHVSTRELVEDLIFDQRVWDI